MTTQTQLMTTDDIKGELGLSDLEIRRSVAIGRLPAMVINPDEITGPKAKQPKYRFKRSHFESFSENLAGIRLPPNFIGKNNFFQASSDGRIRNALKEYANEITDDQWLQMARAEANRLGKYPDRLKDIQLTLSSIPAEVAEVASGQLIQGFTRKVQSSEVFASKEHNERLNKTVAGEKVKAIAISNMRRVLEERHGYGKATLDRVYWSKEEFASLVAAVRSRTVEALISVTRISVELKAEEGRYEFWATVSIRVNQLMSRPKIVQLVESTF